MKKTRDEVFFVVGYFQNLSLGKHQKEVLFKARL